MNKDDLLLLILEKVPREKPKITRKLLKPTDGEEEARKFEKLINGNLEKDIPNR